MARALRTVRRTIAIAQPGSAESSIEAIALSIRALSRLVEGVEEMTAVEGLRGSAIGFSASLRGEAGAPSPELARAAVLFAVAEIEFLLAHR